MIQSIRDKRTEAVAAGRCPKGFPADLMRAAIRKLSMLDAAAVLDDLRSPAGNRLEVLSGARRGQPSLRINEQWGIGFIWTEAGPEAVEIVDYHRKERR